MFKKSSSSTANKGGKAGRGGLGEEAKGKVAFRGRGKMNIQLAKDAPDEEPDLNREQEQDREQEQEEEIASPASTISLAETKQQLKNKPPLLKGLKSDDEDHDKDDDETGKGTNNIQTGQSLRPLSTHAKNGNKCCQALREEIERLQNKLEAVLDTQGEWEAGKLHRRLEILSADNESKQEEIERLKRDVEVIGLKLIDEIEKREEIQNAADLVNNELEELTQTLFEEANSLVANEAREKQGVQEKLQLLSKQLHETTIHLQLEQAQARELRLRIAALDQEREDAEMLEIKRGQAENRRKLMIAIDIHSNSDSAGIADNPDNPLNSAGLSQNSPMGYETLIDPRLYSHFQDLQARAPKFKMTKIHDLLFMRNVLEDDVVPCLRFGGNPRTSTRKFIDAIVANTCFIEMMDQAQILELEKRDETTRRIANTQTPSKTTSPNQVTPTALLFNKTMLERITNVLISPTVIDLPNENAGCATCGREENYKYRFKISDVQDDIWYPICIDCKTRLVAVVDFYTFIRNMRQGLFTSRDGKDLFLESLALRRVMFYTRVGCGGVKNADVVLKNWSPVLPNSSLLEKSSIPPTLGLVS